MFIYLDIESFVSSKFFLEYNFRSDFSVFYFLDFIFVFACSFDHLNFLKNLLYKFFSSRYLRISSNYIDSFVQNRKIDILSWTFYYSNSNKIFSSLSLSSIRLQKLRLKSVIKVHSNSAVYLLIKTINHLVFDWSKNYCSSDFFWDVASELDVYLQKTLWRWARRRHPRRTNIWIYGKYWRKFIGGWRFFSMDSSTGGANFLRSHSLLNDRLFCLPISLNYFDLFNKFKFRKVYNKKFFKLFQGVTKLLWKKQNGLCFVCRRGFTNVNFLNIKVRYVDKHNSKFFNLVILHSSCCIYFMCI